MKRRAFTLIEMIGTLAIIMVMVTVSSIAVGKTLKTNKEKTLQLKVANVLRGTEDFLMQRNIKLVSGIPMYFSVSAMEKAGIFEKGATDAIKEIKDVDNGTFYVEALKSNDGKVEYNILNADEFKKTIAGVNAQAINYNIVASTATALEKEPINIKFELQKPVLAPLYNIDITKLTYTLRKVDGTPKTIAIDKLVKNLKVDKTGKYNFKLLTGLESGSYELELKIISDSLDGVIITKDAISLVISKVYEDALTCSLVDLLTNTWYNNNVSFNVECKQLNTNTPASTISYIGKKYLDISKTNGVDFSVDKTGTDIDANGKTSLNITADGIYEFEIRASLGSQTSKNVVKQTIQVDKTRPAIPTWRALYSDNNIYDTVNAPWSILQLNWDQFNAVETLSGIERFEYSTNCSQNNWLPLTLSSYSYSNDNVSYCLRAVDKAGNFGSASTTANFKVDTTKPLINTTPTSDYGTYLRLTVNASDNLTNVASYSFNGGSTWQASNIKDYYSSTTANVKVKDGAGNISNQTNVTITVTPPPTPPSDTTGPTFSVSGNPTSWTNQNVTLTITGATDISGLHSTPYSFNGGSTWQSSATSGAYTANGNVTVAVRDTLGNVSTQNVNIVYIDKTAPSFGTSISNPKNGVWSTTSFSVSWTATDTGSGFSTTTSPSTSGPMEFSYNQSTSNPTSISQPTGTAGLLSWTSSGSWSAERKDNLYLKITDRAGNSTGWVSAGTVWIDSTAPSCTTSGGSTVWTTGSRTVTGTCGGETTSTSGCVGNVSQFYSTTTGNEINIMASPGTVSDNAGNTRTCAADQPVKIDLKPPSISVNNNSTGTSASPICAGSDNSVADAVTISVSDSGVGLNYSERRWADTGTWGAWGDNMTGASYTTTASAPGDRQLQIRAYDDLGNTTTYTSGHYYLEGPVISAKYRNTADTADLSIPRTSGSIRVEYTCDAWHDLSQQCDSKISTSTGSTLVYSNLSANIISESSTGNKITKYTQLSHSTAYEYFWVRAGNSRCATAATGYRVAKIFN